MDEVVRAIQAGDYQLAYEALIRTPEANTPSGVASAAFLLALIGRFEEADRLISTVNAPAIQTLVRGEWERAARWGRPESAGAYPKSSAPLPYLGIYAGMALALLHRDAARADQVKADIGAQIPKVPGRLTYRDGSTRDFAQLADADDAIGEMLETYADGGLLYMPFAALRRIEFAPPRHFIDALAPVAHVWMADGRTAMVNVPLLYAGSAMSADGMLRSGRSTSFDYIGKARRATGMRDFFLDGGVAVGLTQIASIDFGAPAPSAPVAAAPAAVVAPAAAAPQPAIPANAWLWIESSPERHLVFSYVDPTAGLSAKGSPVSAEPTTEEMVAAAEQPGATFRLAMGWRDPITVVTDDERMALGLPKFPTWIEHFTPPWRRDPRVAAFCHPDFPDDAEVLFWLSGGQTAEKMWVRISSADAHGYRGELLNTPHTSQEVAAGSPLLIHPLNPPNRPVWVSPTMARNLALFEAACAACGCDVYPADLEAVGRQQFPNLPADALVNLFTTRCPLCSQAMTVSRRT